MLRLKYVWISIELRIEKQSGRNVGSYRFHSQKLLNQHQLQLGLTCNTIRNPEAAPSYLWNSRLFLAGAHNFHCLKVFAHELQIARIPPRGMSEGGGPELKSKIVCQAKRLAKCLPCQFPIGRMSIVVAATRVATEEGRRRVGQGENEEVGARYGESG